jgi:putative colanic acid biosynthesis UDP-glucose lipid carrier transferase
LALLFLAPLLAVLALAVRLDSPGPVFYRQLRQGFSKQPIAVLKFRTMHADRCDAADAAVVRQAILGDARVTRLGRFLRKTSLDELPQLLNVLRGEMSLVGPRPHALAHDRHYADLIDDYLGRHRVKPGITGWAQVHGYRGETRTVEDMRKRIELDLAYIDSWSILLDLRILWRTLFVGFGSRNAY